MHLDIVKPFKKECRVCKVEKPETRSYFRWRNDSNKFRTECIECSEKNKKIYRKNNPDKVKATYKKTYAKRKANGKHKDSCLRNDFGITLEEYNKMFEEQGGCCKICCKHQSEQKRALAVDHCHSSGKIRGLLCNNCNKGIGNLQDNLEILSRAFEYVLEQGDI